MANVDESSEVDPIFDERTIEDDDTLIAKIKNSIARVVDDLTTVRVITLVADAQVQIVKDANRDKRTRAHVEIPGNHSAFVTEIDLVDGDLTTLLPKDYGDHPDVAALHERNAKDASKVLIANLEALANTATAIIQAIRED